MSVRSSSRPRLRSRDRDRGLSLVEVLVCVVLVGIAVIAVLGALGGSMMASAQHRKHATADTLLRSAAELIVGPGTAYVTCPMTTSYASVLPTDPSGKVTVTIENVEHWTGTNAFAFSGSCSTDRGAHRITLKATSIDGRVTERLQFLKRRLTDSSGSAASATPPPLIVASTPSRALGILGTGANTLTVMDGMQLDVEGDPIVSSSTKKWAKATKKSKIKISGTTTLKAADPYSAMVYPTTTGLPVYTNGVYQGPGVYRTLPLTISASQAMVSGTYIVEEGMSITGGTVTGTGVFIFNGCASGSAPSCSNAGSFAVSASAKVTLTAPTSGAYANILFFQHRSNTSGLTITGGASSSSFGGGLYLASAKATVIGGTTAITIKGLVAKTAAFSGPKAVTMTIGPAT